MEKILVAIGSRSFERDTLQFACYPAKTLLTSFFAEDAGLGIIRTTPVPLFIAHH